MTSRLAIGERHIGPDEPCLVIAEVGVNHNGDPGTALRMIRVAAEAGACAVKFQAFRAEELVTSGTPMCEYQNRNTGGRQSQLDMLKALELSERAHEQCKSLCEELGVLYLCTPFERHSADFLESLGVHAYKISSGDLTNHLFLRHVASKGKPMILSTGMSNLDEVESAVLAIRQAEGNQLAILQCTSEYPADPAQVNLRAMATLSAAFDTPVGLSDHTAGIEVALAAVALGARIVEKHFTLDRRMPGPDHKASLTPGELKALVKGIRTVEAAMGDGVKRPTQEEKKTAGLVRKSLAAATDIPQGTVIEEAMLTTLRPGLGLPPSAIGTVVGRVTSRRVVRHELISLDMLA